MPGHYPTLYDTVWTFQNCASPFGALMSIEIDKVQKVGKSSSERNFLENGAHSENLARGQAQAR